MAFNINYFSSAGAQSKRGKVSQVFRYRTTDSLATCDTANYFLSAASMLSVGDEIQVQVVDSVTAPTSIVEQGVLRVRTVSSSAIDTYDAVRQNAVVLNAQLEDVSTASSVYVVSPIAGKIIAAYGVLHGAISGANSVVALSIGGVAVTNGSFTVAYSGSAAGDVDSCAPTAANVVTAGQAIKIDTDGGSTGTVKETISILIDPISNAD